MAMPMCEKCWRDAGQRAMLLGGSQVEHYHEILGSRRDKPCTPEEQRGEAQRPREER